MHDYVEEAIGNRGAGFELPLATVRRSDGSVVGSTRFVVMLVRGGERRDSAWYSVLDDEQPEVRENLRRRLGR